MYEVGSKTIEVFACRVGIPVKASYGIAVVSYAFMECCPVSARMRDPGSPFLLESFGVLGHSSFIKCSQASRGYFLNKFLNGVASGGDP